jgi:uncharacterized membrane protein YccF (DUF307 family)
MNKSKTTIALVGVILAIAALAVAAVAVAPMQTAFARSSFNNQQNEQFAFNFNNQQYKSNFQCVGCHP